MLRYTTDTGQTVDKIENAIKIQKTFEPSDGYFLAFSGGKDSQCIYHLCQLAGVKFDAHYSVTSVDPPEVFYFIRDSYPDVSIDIPHDKDGNRISMWSLIASHTLPPTRKVRYCCAELKECTGKGRLTLTGVRWAESARRKQSHDIVDIQTRQKLSIKLAMRLGSTYYTDTKNNLHVKDLTLENRQLVLRSRYRCKILVNPIIDWSANDTWEFLNDVVKVPHCCLYDEGFTRLGCIGCPLAGSKNMIRDFERWPKYKELYVKAFEKMIQNHPGQIKILNSDKAPRFDVCADKGGGGNGVPNAVPQHRKECGQIFDWWINGAEEARRIHGRSLD